MIETFSNINTKE